MTQHELVIEFIRQKGSILPAKMAGVVFMGHMFGSETSKRCRELRAHNKPSVEKYPRLISKQEGKFEVFTLAPDDGKLF